MYNNDNLKELKIIIEEMKVDIANATSKTRSFLNKEMNEKEVDFGKKFRARLDKFDEDITFIIKEVNGLIHKKDFSDMSAYELGLTGSKHAIPYIIQKLQSYDYDSRRLGASAIKKLSMFQEEILTAKPYLLNNLKDSNPQIREYTLKALAEMELNDEDLDIIEEVKQREVKDYNLSVINKILENRLNKKSAQINDEDLPACNHLIKIIGDTGISTSSQIEKYLLTDEVGQSYFYESGAYKYQYLNHSISKLKEAKLINSVEINLEARGTQFNSYQLTDSGKERYYSLFHRQSQPSEVEGILNNYNSLIVGYSVHFVSKHFKNNGYVIKEAPYKNLGEYPLIDLVIEKEGEEKYIVVHTDDSEIFLERLNEIYKFTKDIYLIANTEKQLYRRTKGEIFKWINERFGGFQNGDVSLHFSTLEKIKKHTEPWETFSLRETN